MKEQPAASAAPLLPDYAAEGFGNKLYMIAQTQAIRTLIEFLKLRVRVISKK